MTCNNDVDIIDYQGCQPVNEKLSYQPKKISLSSRSNFQIWGIPHKTRKHSKWQDRKSISAYKNHKNNSTKMRLIQKYLNACICIFISLNLYNFTFVIPFHVSYFTLILIFDSWIRKKSYWSNLDRGSKTQTPVCEHLNIYENLGSHSGDYFDKSFGMLRRLVW